VQLVAHGERDVGAQRDRVGAGQVAAVRAVVRKRDVLQEVDADALAH